MAAAASAAGTLLSGIPLDILTKNPQVWGEKAIEKGVMEGVKILKPQNPVDQEMDQETPNGRDKNTQNSQDQDNQIRTIWEVANCETDKFMKFKKIRTWKGKCRLPNYRSSRVDTTTQKKRPIWNVMPNKKQ